MSVQQQNPLQFAIIGCGLIGKKRAANLKNARLTYACDLDANRAADLAKTVPGCRSLTDYKEALADPNLDAVIIATLNASLAPIAIDAARAGKHVLIEKPGALNAAELRNVKSVASAQNIRVRIGYNHRYHPALQKARQLIDAGEIGEIMFLRGRYGHGGRKGYDREWRADPKLSGGGELIDQGVHLIDLAGWFLGKFTVIEGHAETAYWDMQVDDNAFLSLRTAGRQTAWLHVSCSEWKNLFSLEIYGRTGKLAIDGLGGSYGLEKLTHYKMLPEMGPPETTSWEYPRGDESWKMETTEFIEDIRLGRAPRPGLDESIDTLDIVETIYQKSGYPKKQAGS